MYGSVWNPAEFEAALTAAKTVELPKDGLTVEQVYWRTYWPVASSRDALIRHAEKFGPECVQEVAGQRGIELGSNLVEVDLSRQRKEIERKHADDPGLRDAKLRTLGRKSKNSLRESAVEAILAGEKTVAGVADEFGVQERTVRGWCS